LQQFLAVSSLPEPQPFIPFLSQLPPQLAMLSGLFRSYLCCRHHCSKRSRPLSWLDFMQDIAS
jgi:hypothetical protein